MPKVAPLDRIIPLYRKRVLQRARENEAALRASGAYSPAEFNDLKERMLRAYSNVGRTSAPVINMKGSDFRKFMRSGQYRNLGSTGVSTGENDLGARLRYSNAVYGYEDLPGAEKYGTVPLDELSGKADESRMSRGVVPGSEYGEMRVHLKPNMKMYTTINAFDSMNQWPDNAMALPHRNIMPVPYVSDDPEAYVGALMDAPNPAMEEEFLDTGWGPDAIRNELRARNDETLSLLEGRRPYEYIEGHVHGPITRDDVDFVEMLSWYNSPEAFQNVADRYNVRFVPSGLYRSQRPLDVRRELEPRPRKVESWMRDLRR